MAITIEDIAREAKVSTATISRVINGTKPVSSKLHERVTKIIEEKNFRPNMFARSLITNKTGTIGLVVPDISNPVFGAITKGINNVCRDKGFIVVICESDGKAEKESELLDKLTQQRIEGVLFAGVEVNEALVEKMNCTSYPIVLMTQEESSGLNTMTTVVHNNTQAVYDAMQFLTYNGHRRIAFIGGPKNDYSSGNKRLEGYHMAMHDYGLKVPDSYIVHGDFTFNSGFACMNKIYEESFELPTAVMVCSDLMAVGAIQYARSVNIEVPSSISFMGFDDSQIAAYCTPALSTVRISYYDEGVAAAEALFRCIEGQCSEGAVVRNIPHNLIRRSSVACIGQPVQAVIEVPRE
jgi:LacI family transcriptional regulator